jgi:hypothetical protein
MAEPEDPTPVKMTQMDGSQLTVQLIGDDFFHYYQTTDGLVIERNSAGIFEYVNLLENDSIVLSGISSFISVYPNPVSDVLYIEIDSEAGTMQFNVSNLPNGIYYLHVFGGVSETPEIRQVMVEH